MAKKMTKPVNVRNDTTVIILFIGVLIALPLFLTSTAHAKGFCSATTDAAAKACDDELKLDYWLEVGKCNNMAEVEAREECLQMAKEERNDAGEECKDQTAARQEICEELGEDPYDPIIASKFDAGSVTINNKYLPLTPGTTWFYEGGGEIIIVEVTDETVDILGVTCVVVRDTVYEGGELVGEEVVGGEVVEDTWDWFAQDKAGNVWYFGEHSQEYEDGELVSLEGSWKAGVDKARPGIVMQADPMLFDYYRQEFLLGEAEDMAVVIDTEGTEIVLGNTGTLVTNEWTPLDPEVHEYKHYAEGIGLILEEDAETGDRVELVKITP